MKAVCFEATETVAVIDRPQPAIQSPTDAIIQVATAGLCGSDLHVFHGRETGIDHHTVMGHELVGEIVELGQAASRELKIGDRVATPFTTNCGSCFYCRRGLTCRCESGRLFGWVADGVGLQGAQSEFVRVENAVGSLVKLDSSLNDRVALLLGDNLSTGFFAADCANVQRDDTCAVIGCGTVGLLAVLAATQRGANQIFAVDPVAERRARAKELGAVAVAVEQALPMIHEATQGRGADAVMELVGLPDAQRLAYDIVRPGGAISIIGCHSTPNFAFSPVDAYDKNLSIRTGRCPARRYMTELMDYATDNSELLSGFITHEFAIDDAVRAYDIFANRLDGCIKAVLTFD